MSKLLDIANKISETKLSVSIRSVRDIHRESVAGFLILFLKHFPTLLGRLYNPATATRESPEPVLRRIICEELLKERRYLKPYFVDAAYSHSLTDDQVFSNKQASLAIPPNPLCISSSSSSSSSRQAASGAAGGGGGGAAGASVGSEESELEKIEKADWGGVLTSTSMEPPPSFSSSNPNLLLTSSSTAATTNPTSVVSESNNNMNVDENTLITTANNGGRYDKLLRLDALLSFDARLWKEIRVGLKELYISTMIVSGDEYKRLLGKEGQSSGREGDWISFCLCEILNNLNVSIYMLRPALCSDVPKTGKFLPQSRQRA